MKKGINAWAFPENFKIVEIMKMAKREKFDGVEINFLEDGIPSLTTSDKEIKKIKNIADDLEIEIPSVSTGLLWKYQLSSKNKKLREKGKEIVKRMIYVAKILGANTVLVVPGLVNEEVGYEEAIEISFDALSEIKPVAEVEKVFIGIENVWNKMLLSPLEMNNFIERFNSQYVKSYFDVANVLVYGYPQNWIKILKDKIVKIHLKDFITSKFEFTNILQGDVNWHSVMEELKRIKYNDYLIAEVFSCKIFPEKPIIDSSISIDYLLKKFL